MARATYSGSGLVRSDEARRRSNVDTTLIPPRAQYGATQGNPEQRNQPRNAGFASLCTPLQHMTDHS